MILWELEDFSSHHPPALGFSAKLEVGEITSRIRQFFMSEDMHPLKRVQETRNKKQFFRKRWNLRFGNIGYFCCFFHVLEKVLDLWLRLHLPLNGRKSLLAPLHWRQQHQCPFVVSAPAGKSWPTEEHWKSQRVLHIVFVEFCWAMEILNFNRKLAMGLSLCFSCRISEIGSLWICYLFSQKLLATLPCWKHFYTSKKRKWCSPEIYHTVIYHTSRYHKLPFLKGVIFSKTSTHEYGYIPKASFPNIFGGVNFWGPPC